MTKLNKTANPYLYVWPKQEGDRSPLLAVSMNENISDNSITLTSVSFTVSLFAKLAYVDP